MRFPRSRALEDEVRRRLASAGGRITFAEFMEVALYHDELGYYTNREREPWRDYFTSPEIHPAFGYLVAKQLHEMFQVMGRPQKFTVVEAGAGRGLLAYTILHYAPRLGVEFREALEFVTLEVSAAAVEEQKRILRPYEGAVRIMKVSRGGGDWSGLSAVKGVDGCILSNELLDSLPFHRVKAEGDTLWEVYVTVDGEGLLAESLGGPSTPLLRRYFNELGFLPPRGAYAEVNLRALEWMEKAAEALGRGFVLTVDYGYPARRLYSRRFMGGTLLCYHNHAVNPYPLIRLGYQDITAHVDFTSLVRAGRKAGLRLTGLTTQARFLENLGLAKAPIEMAEPKPPTLEECRKSLALARRLVDPEGLGRLKVLIQHKGLRKPRLTGLSR